MNKVKDRTNISGSSKLGFRIIGLLLLSIFIGRVGLVSVYGYAGVQKPTTSLTTDGNEQEDNDKKDESKYAEKQFKCFAPISVLQPVPEYTLVRYAPTSQYFFCYINTYHLTVLTPPPNC